YFGVSDRSPQGDRTMREVTGWPESFAFAFARWCLRTREQTDRQDMCGPGGPSGESLRWSLSRQRSLSFEPLKLPPLLGRQFLLPEFDLDLPERAGELERHLRVVLVDHRRACVHADVEALIEGELAYRTGLLDPTLGHGFAIDGERSLATLAETAAVVDEIE